MIEELLKSAIDAAQPPPDLTVSEWADAYRMLSPESSAEPGKWNTSRAEYQRGIMDAFSDPLIREVVVMSSAQVGKALATSTPIATPNGWTTMGDISVGDLVFDADGKPTKVIGVSAIMNDRQCYSVRFSDGSDIVADGEHLWEVDDDKRGRRIITTAEMLETHKYGSRKHRNRYAIRVSSPLQLPDIDLPIDPYALGAWLGDGHSASSRIFGLYDDILEITKHIADAGHRITIKPDKTCHVAVIDEKLRHICPRGHNKDITGWSGRGCAECARVKCANYGFKKRNNPLRKIDPIVMTMPRLLSALNLIGNKHIPSSYLRSSENQRLSLLQGLMDTDGYISPKGRQEFLTTSIAIRDGFAELLSSLGIKYTMVEKKPQTNYKGATVYGSTAYSFSFLAYADKPVFRLRRKLVRQVDNDGNRRSSETLRRRIVSVTPVESVPVRCILVENNEHLFLAGREMIPTHNTEAIGCIVGYFIDYDPCPILVLQPTLEMGEAWSKDRLAPMLRDTPALKNKVKDPKSKTSGNTLLHKKFPGGQITIAGANSPSGLASRPIRIVLCDEVDRYPVSAGTEGDPVNLAKKRSTTFWNRKLLLTSTPTIKHSSRIEQAYLQSDQRRYYVPCPDCGQLQHLQWKNVNWTDSDPDTAKYACCHCGALWTDAQRYKAISIGVWKAEQPSKGIAGFHLNELYSPWRKLSEIVSDFLRAKDSPEMLKTFVNTSLGETWEEQGEQSDPELLMNRREKYSSTVPNGVQCLTVGADVQQDRIELEIVGWGYGEESWSIDYQILIGDPTGPEVWDDLRDVIFAEFDYGDEGKMPVSCAVIDSGYLPKKVYEFVRSCKASFIHAGKGVTGAKPIVEDDTKRRRRIINTKNGRYRPELIGVDEAKITIHRRLQISTPGPGFMHFPEDRDAEWFAQLTAEKLTTRYQKGFPIREWIKTRPRNEALDCRVYAMAAYKLATHYRQVRYQSAPGINKQIIKKKSSYLK